MFDKTFQQVSVEEMYLGVIKVIYDNLTANIILNSEKSKALLLRSEIRQACPLSPLLLNIVLEAITRVIRQIKVTQIIEGVKTVTICK